MATYFQNPVNGYAEKATGGWTWLWALLFGPFYLVYKGAWPAALFYLLLALFATSPKSAGLALLVIQIVYAIAIYPIVRKTYLRAGWIETATKNAEEAQRRRPPPLVAAPALRTRDDRV